MITVKNYFILLVIQTIRLISIQFDETNITDVKKKITAITNSFENQSFRTFVKYGGGEGNGRSPFNVRVVKFSLLFVNRVSTDEVCGE